MTPFPATLPHIALPSFQVSGTLRMFLLHMLFPLPAKLILRFLHGLIQITALLLELQLSWSHHSISHITSLFSLIVLKGLVWFLLLQTWLRILPLPLLWSLTNYILIPLVLHSLTGKNELLHSSNGMTCKSSELNASTLECKSHNDKDL